MLSWQGIRPAAAVSAGRCNRSRVAGQKYRRDFLTEGNEGNKGARDERAFSFLDKWGDFPFGVIVKSMYF